MAKKYHITRKYPTKPQIIRNIREKAARDGLTKMYVADIAQDEKCYPVHHIKRRFPGGVTDAIRAAGLYPGVPNKEDLVRALQEFYAEHGRAPRIADANADLLVYHGGQFMYYFGTWNKALEAAGLETRRWAQDFTEEVYAERADDLLRELQELYGESGILPSEREFNRQAMERFQRENAGKHRERSNPPHGAQYVKRYLGPRWRDVAKATNLRPAPPCRPKVYRKPLRSLMMYARA